MPIWKDDALSPGQGVGNIDFHIGMVLKLTRARLRRTLVMAETVPYGRSTQRPSPVAEVHILWITAGLGCDGDSVSVTAATQPSIEDVLLGAIPGLPKVHLHNPVLAYENGDDFLKFWYMAEKGQLEPFVR